MADLSATIGASVVFVSIAVEVDAAIVQCSSGQCSSGAGRVLNSGVVIRAGVLHRYHKIDGSPIQLEPRTHVHRRGGIRSDRYFDGLDRHVWRPFFCTDAAATR